MTDDMVTQYSNFFLPFLPTRNGDRGKAPVALFPSDYALGFADAAARGKAATDHTGWGWRRARGTGKEIRPGCWCSSRPGNCESTE